MPWSSSVRRWVRGFGVIDFVHAFVHAAVQLLHERGSQQFNCWLNEAFLFNVQTNPEGVKRL